VDLRLPIFALIALAFCANAAAAPAEPPPRIEKPANSSPAQPEKPPLNFYLAKGPDDACGAGCNEWIAAEDRGRFSIVSRGASCRSTFPPPVGWYRKHLRSGAFYASGG